MLPVCLTDTFADPRSSTSELFASQDSETEALLTSDFEIGHMIRERIVPRAVLYFTGEIDDDDYDEDDDDDDEDEDEDDEDRVSG